MTLNDFFARNNICGFTPEELRDILSLRSDFRVDVSPPAGVILRGDTIKPLGCIADYFTDDENGKKIKTNKSSSATGACYYIQKELGCNHHATPGECRTCFLSCLALLEAGEVYKRKR